MIEFKNYNKYLAYIFDFDGVLYNTETANQLAYEKTFKDPRPMTMRTLRAPQYQPV